MNSKLLKEAIADAKAVRETALANAKIALEEAFTPKLQSMLSRKIKEELESDDEDELTNENDVSSEIGKGDNKQPATKAFDSAAESDELGKADVTKQTSALGAEDSNNEKISDLKEGETPSATDDDEDVTGATPGTGINEDDDKDGEDYATGAIKESDDADEDDLDLDEIIKELEGDAEEDEAPAAPTADAVAQAPQAVAAAPTADATGADAEIDLDEILREMGYGDDEETAEAPIADATAPAEDLSSNPFATEQLRKEVEEKEKELEEAYSVINSLKGTINEVNLLNAKLLYVNKLFRSYNLTNEQKHKVVETLDRTKNVREVKLVYSTIAESFKLGNSVSKKSPNATKLAESYASKTAKSTAPAKQIIAESNDTANRFKKLAGIIK
jgi:hypothetical protein